MRRFLLSNFPVENVGDISLGQECVIYESLERIYEKWAYYLLHDTEREQIAVAGDEWVKREYTFCERLSKMVFGK